MRRILRGLDSRALACGCLVGVYETYANETIGIIDATGPGCADGTHRLDSSVDVAPSPRDGQPPSTMPTMIR
jgi:hypothetical protein